VSESGGVGFLERDQAAGELEEREVVLGFLRPADQEGAVAVEPGVAGLNDPAAGPPAGSRPFELELVAAAAPGDGARFVLTLPIEMPRGSGGDDRGAASEAGGAEEAGDAPAEAPSMPSVE